MPIFDGYNPTTDDAIKRYRKQQAQQALREYWEPFYNCCCAFFCCKTSNSSVHPEISFTRILPDEKVLNTTTGNVSQSADKEQELKDFDMTKPYELIDKMTEDELNSFLLFISGREYKTGPELIELVTRFKNEYEANQAQNKGVEFSGMSKG